MTGTLKRKAFNGSAKLLFNSGAHHQCRMRSQEEKKAFFQYVGEKDDPFSNYSGLVKGDYVAYTGMFMELLMEGLRQRVKLRWLLPIIRRNLPG